MTNEFEELLQEHNSRKQARKYNSYGVINSVFRILDSMTDKKHGQKFFTEPELGRYEATRQNLNHKQRRMIIRKLVKIGWIKETILPDNITRRGPKPKHEGDDIIHDIVHAPNNNKRLSKLRGVAYYSMTDSGKRIYNNIREVLDAMAE